MKVCASISNQQRTKNYGEGRDKRRPFAVHLHRGLQTGWFGRAGKHFGYADWFVASAPFSAASAFSASARLRLAFSLPGCA